MPLKGFETFEIELQNTLNNFYNPVYKPDELLFEALRVDPSAGLEGAREVLTAAIREMKAPETAPLGSKIDVIYQILEARFLQGQSQEAASEVLSISTRHFRRKQHEAIHALALRLWDKQSRPAAGASEEETVRSAEASRIEAIAQEIQVLTNHSPGITTDLVSVLKKAVDVAGYMQEECRVEAAVGTIPEDLAIPVHPNVLRQIVLYVLLLAGEAGLNGRMEIECREEEERIVLSFTCPGFSPVRLEIAGLETVLSALGGTADMDLSSAGWQVRLTFPQTSRKKILVIDDNLDQIYLYRRLLAATAYEVNHLAGGDQLLEYIVANRPDLILMDILLPEIDGWDLLMQIRKNPVTSATPVVISSVMGNEAMARSLGANGYLLKPVDRKSLLQVLDQATHPRGAGLTGSPL